jgi:Ca-activated chloride channel family protein
VLSVLLCLSLFSSCARTQGKLYILEANFFNTRGYYTEAIASYLKALNYNEAAPYAEFGLASAFFSLEEGEAALARYSEAEKALGLIHEDHPELRYRIHYNMGIILFENGEYEGAIQEFREALKVDGSRIEAKRNLELSLLTSARSPPPQAISSDETEGGGEGAGGWSSVLFEYLKAKEQEQWKSREWTEESDYSGPDY